MIAPRLTAICILVFLAGVLATTWALARQPDPAVLAESCDGGRASSCVYLGVLHRHGRGVPLDYEKALLLHRKACAMGSHFACGYAGEMVFLGLGTAENRAEGATMMRTACNAGDFWSCEALRRNGLRPEPGPPPVPES